MAKRLSEMTLKELWQLFPHPFNRTSRMLERLLFERRNFVKKVLPSVERISHIASTAVSSIWAKPIIDILVEIPKESIYLFIKI